jgi:hypothetical protein
MFTHCVYFWLKDDLKPAETKEFEAGLAALLTIPSVVHGTIGKPASTDRPIIDRSYSWGLVTIFKDLAGHDAYQDSPIHTPFRDVAARCCKKIQIYDFA